MSTAADHSGELIPRPEMTPDALRVAITRIAPHRLPEMERQKNECFSLAAKTSSVKPIHAWMLVWAGNVEIERRPDLSARLHTAEYLVQSLDRDDPRWQAAMDEIRSVLNEARAAVQE